MGLKLKKAINQNFTRLTPKKSYWFVYVSYSGTSSVQKK
jgi:hypothetical protein